MKKTEMLEFSDTLNTTDREDDSDEEKSNEENTGTPDYYICSVYSILHYQILSINRSFFDRGADSLPGYIDVLNPPPKS